MPSKISAFHRELYELPWDRRRFSAHRARVQSAGLLDCLLMFYHFQQMSTLWLTVWVWTFICLCFCDALLYCPGPRIDCGAPPSSDLSHLRQLLPSPSCDKTSFHFHANGVCCHLSQLLPSRCPLSTFFFANGALWLPSRWTLFFFMQMEFAYIFFTFTRRALFWLDTSRFLKFFKSGIKERRSSMRKKDRQIFRWAGALNANSNRCEKANARHIPDSNPYCGRLL